MSDPRESAPQLDFSRFTSAQAPVYSAALHELQSGRKRSHWMWFIFPQLDGLGFSQTTRFYAIKSLEEARQYLAHPLLGARLLECTRTVLAVQGVPASEILPYPDDLKFLSCMTLFAALSAPGSLFEQALEKYFGGERDQRTLDILAEMGK